VGAQISSSGGGVAHFFRLSVIEGNFVHKKAENRLLKFAFESEIASFQRRFERMLDAQRLEGEIVNQNGLSRSVSVQQAPNEQVKV